MGGLRQHKLLLPLVTYMILVVGAPVLIIHHVHRIQDYHPVHNEQTEQQRLHTSPATYEENHIITLRSGDEYIHSARIDVATDVQQFAAHPVDVALPGNQFARFALQSSASRHVSHPAWDTCALFCTFRI